MSSDQELQGEGQPRFWWQSNESHAEDSSRLVDLKAMAAKVADGPRASVAAAASQAPTEQTRQNDKSDDACKIAGFADFSRNIVCEIPGGPASFNDNAIGSMAKEM